MIGKEVKFIGIEILIMVISVGYKEFGEGGERLIN